MENLVKEAYEIFKNDRFAIGRCGARIESITENEVICSMDITEEHLNAAGTVMGGAIFTLADFTFAIAANFRKPGVTVTLDSHICYLGIAKGTQLIAKSHCIRQGRSSAFYEIQITDDQNTQVAKVTLTGHTKSKI